MNQRIVFFILAQLLFILYATLPRIVLALPVAKKTPKFQHLRNDIMFPTDEAPLRQFQTLGHSDDRLSVDALRKSTGFTTLENPAHHAESQYIVPISGITSANAIDSMLELQLLKLPGLFDANDIPLDEMPDDIGLDQRFADTVDESAMCDTNVTNEYPTKWQRDGDDDSWARIVNTPTYRQGVRMVRCM